MLPSCHLADSSVSRGGRRAEDREFETLLAPLIAFWFPLPSPSLIALFFLCKINVCLHAMIWLDLLDAPHNAGDKVICTKNQPCPKSEGTKGSARHGHPLGPPATKTLFEPAQYLSRAFYYRSTTSKDSSKWETPLPCRGDWAGPSLCQLSPSSCPSLSLQSQRGQQAGTLQWHVLQSF